MIKSFSPFHFPLTVLFSVNIEVGSVFVSLQSLSCPWGKTGQYKLSYYKFNCKIVFKPNISTCILLCTFLVVFHSEYFPFMCLIDLRLCFLTSLICCYTYMAFLFYFKYYSFQLQNFHLVLFMVFIYIYAKVAYLFMDCAHFFPLNLSGCFKLHSCQF